VRLATSIAAAVEQQSVTANEVSANPERMAMVSKEMESASSSMQQAARDLSRLGAELNTAISCFEVKQA
jgi:methyl-accepting chemotaxis protein